MAPRKFLTNLTVSSRDEMDLEKDGGERAKGMISPSSNARCSGAFVTTKESKLSFMAGVVESGGGDAVKVTALGGMLNPKVLLRIGFESLCSAL